jgi:hypothetical protein
MMKTHSVPALVILLAATLVAPLAQAADPPELVGAWDVVAVTPDGDLPGVMTLSAKEGVLEAELDIGGMGRPVDDEKLEGDVFTMTVIYDGLPYDVELKVDGDTMEGTYAGSASNGTFTATRRP